MRIVFGLTVLKFDDFFEWNPATQTRGQAFKLYKRNCYFSLSVLIMYGTNCLSQLILDRYHCSCAVSAVWIYLTTCIYNFTFTMYYVYNGFYVFDFYCTLLGYF